MRHSETSCTRNGEERGGSLPAILPSCDGCQLGLPATEHAPGVLWQGFQASEGVRLLT